MLVSLLVNVLYVMITDHNLFHLSSTMRYFYFFFFFFSSFKTILRKIWIKLMDYIGINVLIVVSSCSFVMCYCRGQLGTGCTVLSALVLRTAGESTIGTQLSHFLKVLRTFLHTYLYTSFCFLGISSQEWNLHQNPTVVKCLQGAWPCGVSAQNDRWLRTLFPARFSQSDPKGRLNGSPGQPAVRACGDL